MTKIQPLSHKELEAALRGQQREQQLVERERRLKEARDFRAANPRAVASQCRHCVYQRWYTSPEARSEAQEKPCGHCGRWPWHIRMRGRPRKVLHLGIAEALLEGLSVSEVATMYEVGERTVQRIKRRARGLSNPGRLL